MLDEFVELHVALKQFTESGAFEFDAPRIPLQVTHCRRSR